MDDDSDMQPDLEVGQKFQMFVQKVLLANVCCLSISVYNLHITAERLLQPLGTIPDQNA